MSGCPLATASARGGETERPRHPQDAGFVKKRRRPRRSCGAAGTPNQTKMQAIVLEEVHSSMEGTHKVESYSCGRFSHQVTHTLRRQARLMEPAGGSSFSEESGAVFSTHTFMADMK